MSTPESASPAPIQFQQRHFHLADWSTRVVFKCVAATRLELTGDGRPREIAAPRETCPLRRKLEGAR